MESSERHDMFIGQLKIQLHDFNYYSTKEGGLKSPQHKMLQTEDQAEYFWANLSADIWRIVVVLDPCAYYRFRIYFPDMSTVLCTQFELHFYLKK